MGYICFMVAQTVKDLPAVWETQVQSLDWEDPLEKETATHSSIPAWRSPWTEELPSMGPPVQGAAESNVTEWLTCSLCHFTVLLVANQLYVSMHIPSPFKKRLHLLVHVWLLWVIAAARALSQSQRVRATLRLRSLQSTRASGAEVRGLSCSAAHGIFPGRGSDPCPPHWQADS